ncbi:MAG: hypothetical protein IPG46_02850 [Actinobacteria bacterium]|jgi:hypothetical protein|nr:hypothetical protein [Actinomycetota bacterium]
MTGTVGLIILGVAALAVAVAVAVGGRIKSHSTTVVLRGTPDEVLNDIRLAVALVRGHSTLSSGPSSLAIRFGITPAWVPLICILFFPFGLLALLGRRTETSTLVAEPDGPGRTRLRIAGRFDERAIGRINQVIEARSS